MHGVEERAANVDRLRGLLSDCGVVLPLKAATDSASHFTTLAGFIGQGSRSTATRDARGPPRTQTAAACGCRTTPHCTRRPNEGG